MIYQQRQPIEINDSFSSGGVADDPTTLTYSILGPDGVLTSYVWPGAAEITHNGVGSFTLDLDPPAFPGDYSYDVVATGAVTAARAGSFTVLPSVAVPDPVPWAVPGPCQPWCDSQAVWDCCGQPMTTIGAGTMATQCPVDMTQYAVEASQVLYELSGRQYAGACEKTVRPCSSRNLCGFQVLSRGHIVWDPTFFPFWNGSNWWWGSGSRGCGCVPMDRILLSGYPVREIVEVKIDGVAIASSGYRLDERKYLTRMRDSLNPQTVVLWPSCQIMDLPDTEAGTFSVTYRYGQDPGTLGVEAAAQVACELYKSCSGQECSLPTGATRVTRQGITIERNFFARDRVTGVWRTGMAKVDMFLNSVNPDGLRRRPASWGPDGLQYARSVG